MSAQIKKPSLSPRAVTEISVGLANVILNYGQPNKQNRQVFGGLIPYGKLWRTGANTSTKISFDREVQLSGNLIPKGDYGLYSIPGEKEWTIIIHKDNTLWGAGGYEEANDLLRFTVPVISMKDTFETLYIGFENFHTNGGDMIIMWEQTKICMPLFVDSDAIIFKEINDKIKNVTGEANAQTYFDAAQFYYHKKVKLDQANVWFDKAIELKPKAFWFVYYSAELSYHLNDYKKAEKNARKCLKAAQLNPSTDYGYIAKCELLLDLIENTK